MAVTFLPYLFGFGRFLQGANPSLGWFSWLGYNLDDGCVYLSWLRQAADGHLFQRNLFTTEPQVGHQVNLFFLLLGTVARVTHLPLLAVWHGARLVLGLALIRAVWWLLEMLVADRSARRLALLVLCVSAGLGWLPGLWVVYGQTAPVDVWQPEAITFLSLYLSPLNLVSLLLMVGILGNLLRAEQTGSWRGVSAAGICGFLLGNIHSYDVISLALIWAGFLLVRSLVRRRFHAASWGRALTAGISTAVSTGYVYYQLSTEAIFAKRAAVETLSPPFTEYALGFGLVLVLALVALALFLRRGDAGEPPAITRDALLFLIVWSAGNFAAAYLPFPFQRKLIMGEQIPLAILAGLALNHLLGRLVSGSRRPVGAAVLFVLALTNLRFMLRDVQSFQSNIAQSLLQRPYLYAGEVQSLVWLRDHAPVGVPIQPLPWVLVTPDRKIALADTSMAAFAPGLTGHPVNAGHWGETPDFGQTMGQWTRFIRPDTPDQFRRALLRQTGVRYVVFSQKHLDPGDAAALSLFQSPPPYLRLVPEASNEDADVYAVDLSAG